MINKRKTGNAQQYSRQNKQWQYTKEEKKGISSKIKGIRKTSEGRKRGTRTMKKGCEKENERIMKMGD